MEVIISAAVLVVVVLGILAGLDAVTSTAGANKARTVAATLAEKDQERLRGMRIPDVDAMNTQPYDVKVGNVTYRVESKAVWIDDASSQEIGCGLAPGQGQGSYMRITSTVTSPMTGDKVKPVVLSSIVAPQVGAAASGSLAVLVKSAAGQGVPGVSVTAVGPKTPPVEVTNDAGCAVFGDLTAGPYKVTLARTGYVDKEGVSNPTNDVTVTAGSMSTQEFAYDAAASVTLNVKSLPGSAAEPSRSVIAANGQLGGGLRAFAPTASIVSALDDTIGSPAVTYRSGSVFSLTSLFPFTDGYTFFSGVCAANDPTKAIPDPSYVANYGGRLILGPGQNGGTINVYEPTISSIFVRRGTSGSTPVTGVPVFAYPTNSGCTNLRIKLGTTDGNGKILNAGLPFGNYTLCANNSTGSRWGTLDISVNSVNGISSQQTISAASQSTARVCGETAP